MDRFKEAAYTKLAPQFVLEDLGLQIANEIFNENYRIWSYISIVNLFLI